jgi:hypothetical protein
LDTCPTVLNIYVPARDESNFAQALMKRADQVRPLIGRGDAEIPNHRHRSLLRPRHHRPRSRHAAEKRDELPPLHVSSKLGKE